MKYKVSVGVIATDPPVKQGEIIDGSQLGDALAWHIETGSVIALDDSETEASGGEDDSETEADNGGEKPLSKMNKAELIAVAESKGIEIPDPVTVDALRDLIKNAPAV
jgi:hypothetical protein